MYALLSVLLSFEFYSLYSKQYEKYILAEIESDSQEVHFLSTHFTIPYLFLFIKKLEDIFNEMERLHRDLRVIKTILPDKFNLGVFLVDITEFKQIILNEILQKDALIKKQL